MRGTGASVLASQTAIVCKSSAITAPVRARSTSGPIPSGAASWNFGTPIAITVPPAEVFSAAGPTSAIASALGGGCGAGTGGAVAGCEGAGAAAPGAAEALGELVVQAPAASASQTRYLIMLSSCASAAAGCYGLSPDSPYLPLVMLATLTSRRHTSRTRITSSSGVDMIALTITVRTQICNGVTTTPKGWTRRRIPMTTTLFDALRCMATVREGFVVRNLDGAQKTDSEAN